MFDWQRPSGSMRSVADVGELLMSLTMSAFRFHDTNTILDSWMIYKGAAIRGEKMHPNFAPCATVSGVSVKKLFADVTRADFTQYRNHADVIRLCRTRGAVLSSDALEDYFGRNSWTFMCSSRTRTAGRLPPRPAPGC